MTVSLPIGRRASKCFVPGASAIYLFNEGSGTSLLDHSGNGYHGTLGAGAAAPTWTATGLSFDGGDSVTVPGFVAGSAGLSVVVVYNQTAAVTNSGIINQFGGNGTKSWSLLNGTPGKIQAFLSADGSSTAKNYNATGVVTNSEWATLGFSWNNIDLVLYKDGAPLDVTKTTDNAMTTVFQQTANPILIGTTTTTGINAGIAAALVYPSGLTPSQITQTCAVLKTLLAPRGITLP